MGRPATRRRFADPNVTPPRMFFPNNLVEAVVLVLVFMLGAAWGSFINVVAGRLPLEKSVLWPASHCLSCLRPLNTFDNLPIIGWLMRRGQCRFCGAAFSSRYLWVELLSGLMFAGLFHAEILRNWHNIPFLTVNGGWSGVMSLPPWQSVVFFLQHATLASFLLAASLCDIDHRSIPLSLTTLGTVIGLITAALLPWPWPNDAGLAAKLPADQPWAFNLRAGSIPSGLYVWPVWGPLPKWLPAGSVPLGLVTGLAGAAAGMFLVRGVKFMFEKGLGKEALGLGDADLMMMAGAFVGWQVVVVAFFVGSILSLPVGILIAIRKGERTLPFGPGLALGVMVTLLGWPWLGSGLQPYLFDEFLVLLLAVFMGGGLFLASVVLRLLGRGN